jgi:hypothetical protein
MQIAATWLFVLPVFTAGVARAAAKIEVVGLAVLAFAAIVILLRPLPGRAIERIYVTFAALALIVIAYLAFRPWPSYFGTARAYETGAALFVATYVAVAVFAVLFFEQWLFERVMWRAATLTLWVGLITCVISLLTGHPLLVNPAYGGLRMRGTLSEPSAWAPVLALVVLLALRRRSWLYAGLGLAGLVLSDSPTCILVMAVTVPLYYALASTWRHRTLLLLALAVSLPAGAFFIQHANPGSYLDSGNPASVAVGRLLSGIRNVETGGQTGSNDRVSGTTVVIAEVRDNDWMRTGAGPAADSTYFPAKYPAGGGVVAATNSLWTSVLFDFGEGGVVVLGVLMLAATCRMRRRPVMTALLLPFFVTALVNSAEGAFEYAFVALGIMLFAFGWIPARDAQLTASADISQSWVSMVVNRKGLSA